MINTFWQKSQGTVVTFDDFKSCKTKVKYYADSAEKVRPFKISIHEKTIIHLRLSIQPPKPNLIFLIRFTPTLAGSEIA